MFRVIRKARKMVNSPRTRQMKARIKVPMHKVHPDLAGEPVEHDQV
jgi:hypothetical protein